MQPLTPQQKAECLVAAWMEQTGARLPDIARRPLEEAIAELLKSETKQ